MLPYEPALLKAIEAGLAPFKVSPPQSLSEWANENFYLSAESSYVEGRWSAYPPQVGMLDLMGNDEVEILSLAKAGRLGYTKGLLAAVCYFARHKRRNVALWQPTDEDRDEFVKTEVDPALRDVEAMRAVMPNTAKKSSDNTLKQKRMIGSTLHLRGATSAKNFRRISVDVVMLDELDAMPRNVDKEGDPSKLAWKRTEGATFRKMIRGSTPRLRKLSLIEDAVAAADIVLRYHVPCPHCHEEHALGFGDLELKDADDANTWGMKWVAGEPDSVRHACPHCGGLMSQADYLSPEVWGRGRWKSEDGRYVGPGGRFFAPDGTPIATPRNVGMHLWTAYSPQASWAELVREFLEAKAKQETGDWELMTTFVNMTLGVSFEQKLERLDADRLEKRAGSHPLREVPRWALFVFAGVDVQDDRFEVVLWAFGRGERMLAIDYTVLPANPAIEADWKVLDAYLLSKFPRTGGGDVGIDGAGIDSGGHHTHMVYNFCRTRAVRRIYAVKGESRLQQPIASKTTLVDVNWRGRVLKSGVRLHFVGTDTAKDLFHGRLKVPAPGPGYVEFPAGLPHSFYTGLAAEARVLQRTARGDFYLWTPVDERNEPLDCTVYAIWGAALRGLHTYTNEMWLARERELGLDRPPEQAHLPRPAPPPRRAPSIGSDEWSSRL